MCLATNSILLITSGGFLVLYGLTHFLNRPYLAHIFQSITGMILFSMTFTRLNFSNWMIDGLAGGFFGFVIFGISLGITAPYPLKNLIAFIQNLPHAVKTDIFKKNIKTQGFTAILEEVFWRLCVQGILIQYLSMHKAILITGCLFWVVHTHRFKNSIPRMVELFLFSLLLGYSFELSQSILLCIVMHFMRNMLIIGYRMSLSHENNPTPAAT